MLGEVSGYGFSNQKVETEILEEEKREPIPLTVPWSRNIALIALDHQYDVNDVPQETSNSLEIRPRTPNLVTDSAVHQPLHKVVVLNTEGKFDSFFFLQFCCHLRQL